MASPSGKAIAKALSDVIGMAEPTEVKALKDALAAFATRHPRSYSAVRQQPFARALLDAMVEATDEYFDWVIVDRR